MNLEIVQSRNVLELITVANEFCIFTESMEKHPLEHLVHYYQRITPLLYLKGMLLPEIKVEDTQYAERFVIEEEWEKVYKSCLEKFGEQDHFLKIDTEDGLGENPSKGSISECISDIYQDLKDFIMLFQKNTLSAKENAVHEVKELFIQHWGIRCLDICKALHPIGFKKEQADEEK